MKISMITPSFNPGAQIIDTCESLAHAVNLIERLYPAAEVEQIIMDDGSDDTATRKAYDTIGMRFPFVRLVFDGYRQQGPASARNRALDHARGTWVGFIDADDLIDASGLAALVGIALTEPDAHWVFGDSYAFFPDGSKTPKLSYCRKLLNSPGQTKLLVPPDQLTPLLAGPPNLFLGSMILRKSVLEAAGGFDERFICGEDWYLTLVLSLSYSAWYVPKTVELLRRGHISLTQTPDPKGFISFKATLRAISEPRFSHVRKFVRWTLLAQIKHLRDHHRMADHRWKAFGTGMLASILAPEEPGLLLSAISCLTDNRHENM